MAAEIRTGPELANAEPTVIGRRAAIRRSGQAHRSNDMLVDWLRDMTDLLLQPSPARGPNDYEVIADDWIVGRIVLSDASPAEKPWIWSLDHEFYQGRERTYGYEATREAAMQAFALCWSGENESPVAD
jgi:hypothetical protein